MIKNREVINGSALWSYEHEVRERDAADLLAAHTSFVLPFHRHKGQISLTEREIILDGDETIHIPLDGITQLYLGFDEVFTNNLAKNFGLTWQPLRLALADGRVIYLLIDYSFGVTKNKLWYEGLKEFLS